MNREVWEHQFALLLKQKLDITPEQVHFHWKVYHNQRFSPEQAIADLERKHELYPELGLLKAGETTKKKSL